MKNVYLPLLLFFQLILIEKNTAQSKENLDYKVLKRLSDIQTKTQDGIYKFISNSTAPVTIATPIAMFGVGLLSKNKNLTRNGIQTGIAFGLTIGETYLLKKIIKRPRPYNTYSDLHNVTTESSYSFPSGHTSSAFSTATSVSLMYPKWYVIVPAFAYAGATGFSRMYLNVHYPSDVLAGAALGSFTAWATWKINEKIKHRK